MTAKDEPEATPDRLPPGVKRGRESKEQRPLSEQEADDLEAQLRAGERATGFAFIRPKDAPP